MMKSGPIKNDFKSRISKKLDWSRLDLKRAEKQCQSMQRRHPVTMWVSYDIVEYCVTLMDHLMRPSLNWWLVGQLTVIPYMIRWGLFDLGGSSGERPTWLSDLLAWLLECTIWSSVEYVTRWRIIQWPMLTMWLVGQVSMVHNMFRRDCVTHHILYRREYVGVFPTSR